MLQIQDLYSYHIQKFSTFSLRTELCGLNWTFDFVHTYIQIITFYSSMKIILLTLESLILQYPCESLWYISMYLLVSY